MKETKKFFDANGLNKGYGKALFNKPASLAGSSSNQYKHSAFFRAKIVYNINCLPFFLQTGQFSGCILYI